MARPSDSDPKQQQAAFRPIRASSKHSLATITRVHAYNTYHGCRISRQVDRLIPDLAPRSIEPAHLAAMLNALPPEVKEVHESDLGKELRETEDLLVDSYTKERERDIIASLVRQGKRADRVRSRDTLFVDTGNSSGRVTLTRNGPLLRAHSSSQELDTSTYFDEWRKLPAKTKALFSHERNMIRRTFQG